MPNFTLLFVIYIIFQVLNIMFSLPSCFMFTTVYEVNWAINLPHHYLLAKISQWHFVIESNVNLVFQLSFAIPNHSVAEIIIRILRCFGFIPPQCFELYVGRNITPFCSSLKLWFIMWQLWNLKKRYVCFKKKLQINYICSFLE